MNEPMAIEMAPFRLAAGVGEDALLEASGRLEREFLAMTDGYLGRVLLRRSPDQWCDMVFWATPEHAATAMAAAAASEPCGAYFACMLAEDHADPSNGVTLFDAVRWYRGG